MIVKWIDLELFFVVVVVEKFKINVVNNDEKKTIIMQMNREKKNFSSNVNERTNELKRPK